MGAMDSFCFCFDFFPLRFCDDAFRLREESQAL